MAEINEARLKAHEQLTRAGLTIGQPAGNQPGNQADFDHWRWHLDDDNIAWAILDKKDSSTNTLSTAVLTELNAVLDEISAASPKAMVMRSLKKTGFAAGAEVSEFVEMRSQQEIKDKISNGLMLLDKLAALPFPTIALIHGFCLGGGLELALAFDYRIARPDAKFGFPEVLLGLHPGLAGTWRSLALAPPVEMMTAMLTGKTIIGKKAKRMGLIDAAIPERHFANAVKAAIDGKMKKSPPARSFKSKAMSWGPVRSFIAGQMEKQTAAKARIEHYPAPFEMIELWRQHGGDAAAMRSAETDSFARLMTSDTSRNLVRTFFLREKLKGFAKDSDAEIAHVHVIGAGVMGGDIAAVCAKAGFSVSLQDREIGYIGPAIKRAAAFFKKRLYSDEDRQAALDRLMPDPQGLGLAKADLVIEAVPEDVDIKAAVYAQCEAVMKEDAILATNTSSILLERLRQKTNRPDRFIGIHFFNPVAKMPLVEIVTHDTLSDTAKARAIAFVDRIDKLPLPVKSAPGFLVNRALTPYMMEAFVAYSEGLSAETIDKAAEEFGMPMGPIELADTVGLDVGKHVAEMLKSDLDKPFPDIPDWFEKLIADGHLGKKTGKGLYTWVKGKPQKDKTTQPVPDDLADRLILPLLNAVADCLEEGIIDGKDVTDAGMIFGTGFAPFRGGPLHYAQSCGIDHIIERLEALSAKYGARFTPSNGWEKIRAFSD